MSQPQVQGKTAIPTNKPERYRFKLIVAAVIVLIPLVGAAYTMFGLIDKFAPNFEKSILQAMDEVWTQAYTSPPASTTPPDTAIPTIYRADNFYLLVIMIVFLIFGRSNEKKRYSRPTRSAAARKHRFKKG